MDIADAQKLKNMEAENAKLKRLLADAMLDNAALKSLLGKKWWRGGNATGLGDQWPDEPRKGEKPSLI